MTTKQRILIVEDERLAAEDLTEVLGIAGYEVVAVAATCDDAVSLATERQPHLVLMDIVLEGQEDGIEAASIIRSKLDIPVVFLTALTDDETLQRVKEAQPFGYLVKPFSERELVATIEMALNKYELENRLRIEEERLRQANEELENRVRERTAHLLELNQEMLLEIAEREELERSLRNSEQRLELALKGADLGLWDLNVSTGDAVVNQRTAKIIGYEIDEITPHIDFWAALLHPEDRSRAIKAFYAHIDGRTDYYEDEYRIKAKSGQWKWVLARGKVVERGADGKPLRMTGTYLDITSRKETEESLRRSEERYRTVADFTYDWEYWSDPSGKFLYVSPSCEGITGYSVQEFLDDHTLLEQIVHSDDRERFVEHLREVSKSSDDIAHTLDFRIVRRSGEVRWISHACQPVYSQEGSPLGRRVCNRDITDRKKVENSLTENEARYRALFENISNGVAIYRAVDNGNDFVLVDFNKAAETISGLSRNEVVSRSVREVFPGVEQFGLLDLLRATWETGRSTHHPISKYSDARLEIWTENFICKLPSGEVVAVFSDVTERRRAETALRESEEKYRATFNNAAVGMDLVDSAGRFVQVNETLSNLLGYAPEELLSLSVFDVTHPEDLQRSKEGIDALTQGKTQSYRLEKRYLRKDGTVVWADTSLSAIRGEDGQHRATVGVIMDITDRKKTEDVLLRLATAVEQAAETIVITDTDGNILYANPAFERTTGYSRSDALGKNPRIIKSGKHDDVFYRHMWQTISGGKVWSGRFVNRKKDGTLFEEEATISPIKDDAGRVVNYVAVKRDVTKEVSLHAQLLQAQKMEAIGTLAGGIAHDFNNLLTVISGFSELLLMGKEKDTPEYEDLSRILYAATNGAELVQRLLTFSQKVEPRSVPMNLNRQIMQVEKLLRRTLPKMIDIQLDLAPDVADIFADRAQAEQVLMNLALNARDAMPDGGTLTIQTKNAQLSEDFCEINVGAKQGRFVRLRVSDTGHGMDDATLEHIFEPFYTTKELGRGTGLGLASVYGIMSQHGGYITCKSELGQGTTFEAYFPAISETLQPSIDRSEAGPACGVETILVVDDEEFVRELGARILTGAGYTVLQASNGKEAEAIFRERTCRISLVVLDLIMPEMGGRECLKRLLGMDPNTKVLISSGYSADSSVQECLESGARGFVHKPFNMKDLLQQVRKVLDMEQHVPGTGSLKSPTALAPTETRLSPHAGSANPVSTRSDIEKSGQRID
jgi:two-component system cell cycle sensor histidine kinase/response regulator CckA